MKKWLYIGSICAIALGAALFWHQPPPSHPYNLAVCAMFKNEASWLKEWLEYHHRALGVDHFYLYNNDSSDNYAEVLQPYLEAGLVEIIDWSSSVEEHAIRGIEDVTFIPYQLGAYNDCLKKRSLGQARWVAIIDIDEFIVPVHGARSLQKLLDQAADSDIGSLLMPWRVFGTSHVEDLAPSDLLIEKLSQRAPDDHSWNEHTKSIHRPEAIEFCLIHESKQLYPGYRRKRLSAKKFRIHHYWARTEKFCRQKRNLCHPEGQKLLSGLNTTEDRTIFQYIPLLRDSP